MLKIEQPNPVLDPVAWFAGNSDGRAHPVGTKAPNSWGLADLLGNVNEWVWDLHGPFESGPAIDPIGARSGWDRVIRGGSWESPGRSCRSAYRGSYAPDARHPSLGFRPVRTFR